MRVKQLAQHNAYSVSDEGDVFRGTRKLRPYSDKDGYLRVSLSFGRRGAKKARLVHQLVLEAFVRLRLPGEQCRHLNGQRNDNKLQNLAWGTARENYNDRERHCTQVRGEEHGRSKLNRVQVSYIRSQHGRVSSRMLAKKLHLSKTTVLQIWRGETWRHA